MPDGVIDVEQRLRLLTRHRQSALAARPVEDAADQRDLRHGDVTGIEWTVPGQAGAVDDRAADFRQRHGRQAKGHRARGLHDSHQQFEFGLGTDMAVLGEAPDQPLRGLAADIAVRLGLHHDMVGHGLDEEVRPVGDHVAHALLDVEDEIRLGRVDQSVGIVVPAQRAHVLGLDAAGRSDPVQKTALVDARHGTAPPQVRCRRSLPVPL